MKKMLTAGMVVVAMVLVLGLRDSTAGSKGILQVSANVLPKLSQTMMRQEKVLKVTKENISAGYVDIEAGTVLQIKSNDPNGYFLNVLVDGQLINEAQVNINGRTISVQAGIGLINKPFPGIAGETVVITYRLILSSKTLPGSYQWPVTVIASLL
jgi:hypothetical protein